jgi:molecular chaperone GrpE (heat shock protein)
MSSELVTAGAVEAMPEKQRLKDTGEAISRRLREYYDALKDEAIPDQFLDLLERLDEADRAQSSRNAGQSRQSSSQDSYRD